MGWLKEKEKEKEIIEKNRKENKNMCVCVCHRFMLNDSISSSFFLISLYHCCWGNLYDFNYDFGISWDNLCPTLSSEAYFQKCPPPLPKRLRPIATLRTSYSVCLCHIAFTSLVLVQPYGRMMHVVCFEWNYLVNKHLKENFGEIVKRELNLMSACGMCYLIVPNWCVFGQTNI